MEPFERDSVEGWIGDFIESTPFRQFSGDAREAASAILMKFMETACEGKSPGDLEEPDVKRGLLEGVARLQLEKGARALGPPLIGVFLEFMETEGRLSGGRRLGAYARALGGAFEKESKPEGTPFKKPGSTIGRNDPCPCGSGKKYKKCCGSA